MTTDKYKSNRIFKQWSSLNSLGPNQPNRALNWLLVQAGLNFMKQHPYFYENAFGHKWLHTWYSTVMVYTVLFDLIEMLAPIVSVEKNVSTWANVIGVYWARHCCEWSCADAGCWGCWSWSGTLHRWTAFHLNESSDGSGDHRSVWTVCHRADTCRALPQCECACGSLMCSCWQTPCRTCYTWPASPLYDSPGVRSAHFGCWIAHGRHCRTKAWEWTSAALGQEGCWNCLQCLHPFPGLVVMKQFG